MTTDTIALLSVGLALAGLILTQLRGLRSEVAGLRGEIAELRAEFSALRERVAHLEGLLQGLRDAIAGRAPVT